MFLPKFLLSIFYCHLKNDLPIRQVHVTTANNNRNNNNNSTKTFTRHLLCTSHCSKRFTFVK